MLMDLCLEFASYGLGPNWIPCVGLEDIVVCRIKSESQIVAMIVTKWLFGHF